MELNFSTPYAQALHEQSTPVVVNTPSIILELDSVQSNIHCSGTVHVNNALVLSSNVALLETAQRSHPYSESITNEWQHVYTIFPLPHLKDTALWRSSKQTIGKYTLNWWYAKAGTHCGIHNTHNFYEVHTQLYGVGRMQKFTGNTFDTLSEETYMAPGYTHRPFFDMNADSPIYPWHQYYADTDCIWLAVEWN